MSDYLTQRLANWGRVMRDTVAPRHCGSVEWHFVQHRTLTEGEEQTRRTAATRVDLADAHLVERAWASLSDDKHKALLLQRYVWHSRDERICQRLRIPPVRVNGTLVYLVLAMRMARAAIETALLDLEQISHDHVGRQAENLAERRKRDAALQASVPLDKPVRVAAG